MRTLIVTDYYPPFIGGAHRQSQLLARELSGRGHEVTVVTSWQPNLPGHEIDGCINIYRLRGLPTFFPWFRKNPTQSHHTPFPDPVTAWQLRRLINRLRPELVHSFGWISYSGVVALVGKNIPLLITSRDYAYSCPTRILMYKDKTLCSGPAAVKCLTCAAHAYGKTKGAIVVGGVLGGRSILRRNINGIHSISRYVQYVNQRDFLDAHKGWLDDTSFPDVIIPSFREDSLDGVPIDDGAIRAFLSRLPKEPYILFVGGLHPHKGFQTLLAAYGSLQHSPPLVLIGYPWPDTPQAFPLGVTVFQNVPHAHVMAAWKNCLFGVAPSIWPEPFGGVIHEAMSRGKAIIGTIPGGHSDMIVDGETGFLVPSGDVEALTQAMKRLISDAKLREKIGSAARAKAEEFTAHRVIPQFEDLYEEVVTTYREAHQ